jgi:hypothetical protein
MLIPRFVKEAVPRDDALPEAKTIPAWVVPVKLTLSLPIKV